MSVGLCLRLNVNIFLSYYIVLNIFTPYHFAFLHFGTRSGVRERKWGTLVKIVTGGVDSLILHYIF